MRALKDSHATLEETIYSYSVRSALKLTRAFVQDGPRILLLVVPHGGDLLKYEHAAQHSLKTDSAKRSFVVATPTTDRRGKEDFGDVRHYLKTETSVVILVFQTLSVPRDIMAAVDLIGYIGPVRPSHVASAIRTVVKEAVTTKQAKDLMEYSLDAIALAVRPGRSLQDALEKLRTAYSLSDGLASAAVPRLEDLHGYGDAKQWGLDLAVDIKEWREGKIRWSDVDTGLLLSGPSGTGKTLFAAALAESCGATFISTSVAQWQANGHLGDLLKAMRKTFKEAADSVPCVLFLDEFDSIGDRKTFTGDYARYSMEVVNGLLECLDGSVRREGVVVVGATNHPARIDAALLRPGRLDRHIVVPLPDYESRQEIIIMHFEGALLIDDVRRLARLTEGFSGADIAKLARDARRTARRNGTWLSVDHVISNLPAMVPIEGKYRRAICVHEAGHAIVGIDLKLGTLEAIAVPREIRADCSTSGATHFVPDGTRTLDRQTYLDDIAMTLGGMAAEQVILGTMHGGSGGSDGSDIARAVATATKMQAVLGMGEGLAYSRASSPDELERLRKDDPLLRRRVEAMLAKELQRAKEIVTRRTADLERIAEALSERALLDKKDIDDLLAQPACTEWTEGGASP
jgi:cell division protease FtsH